MSSNDAICVVERRDGSFFCYHTASDDWPSQAELDLMGDVDGVVGYDSVDQLIREKADDAAMTEYGFRFFFRTTEDESAPVMASVTFQALPKNPLAVWCAFYNGTNGREIANNSHNYAMTGFVMHGMTEEGMEALFFWQTGKNEYTIVPPNTYLVWQGEKLFLMTPEVFDSNYDRI